MVPLPRIMMDGSEPGLPKVLFTCTPVTVPSRALVTVDTGRFMILSESTEEIAPVRVDLLAAPYAIVTTASCSASLSEERTALTVAATGSSWVSIPMNEKTRTLALEGTLVMT